MTRWKVDDMFSSKLMPEFYNKYLNQNFSKTEALAAAKRILLNQPSGDGGVYHQHPLFWASFSLFGDPGGSGDNMIVLRRFVFIIIIAIIFSLILWGYYRVRKNGVKNHNVAKNILSNAKR
jgi:hypothetical protein